MDIEAIKQIIADQKEEFEGVFREERIIKNIFVYLGKNGGLEI